MGDNPAGSDDDLNTLFDRVSNKLGWKCDANFDELFEQLSQSTKKKKSKRVAASAKKKKKSQTNTKKKTRDPSNKQSKPSGAPPFSSGLSDPSQDSSSCIAGISRNLKLEFQAEKACSADISVAHEEEGKTVEVLRETAPVVSAEIDSAASPSLHDDAWRTGFEWEEHPLHGKPEHADEPSRGSEGDRQEKTRHSSEDKAFENKENEAPSRNERTSSSDEDVVSSNRKLSESSYKGFCTSTGAAKKDSEDDVSNIFTEDFTESPQPMKWLMSPPPKPSSSAPSPSRTLNSDSNDDESNIDSNDNDDDFGDIFGANIPSLTERLAQNHLENKRKETASRKNRRRSCANPRAAPLVLDNEWMDEEKEEVSGQEDKVDGILKGEARLEAEDDGEEERKASDRDDQVLQKKDRETLNTNAESFRKARTRRQDSSSDDDFESFLKAVKTPQHLKQQGGQSDSEEGVYVVDDDDDDFINDTPLDSKSDDDNDNDVFYHKVINLDNPLTSGKKTTKKHPTVGSRSGSILSQLLSSSDDDEDVFVIPSHTPSLRKPSSKASTSTTSSKKTPAKQRRPLHPTTLPTNRCFSTPSRTERPAPVSFLASLSTPGKGMSTRSRYVSDFKRNKDELTQKLFKLYNESVFENKLPSDFSVTWNNRMRKTAGFCFYKKRLSERTARIELSVKVCDTAERLRDTLVHELCHAAAWLIHGVSDGHGKYWKYWAAKSNLAHPEIPVIKRCHTYEITTKFKYKCVQCGNIIGRHSKSVDTKRFCCAYCNGRLELQPTLRKDGTPARARGPNPFAAFVKENYASVKKTHGAAKHAEVMRLLSQEFGSKTKITDA
ncbi:acidic repeat-containing protein [Strongylocentrotus purpuratus]|uniref:SprT-like domain-containing protein n=1 Tax=Strongylocentrotus purpuratus TaxID=7668 RepID=A0A7M7RG74_STRPU|nr:acidic repeat-containing protein [Strongylocentrotus purpuratus]|eukprot:XP_792984.3 PREDICTED: acidic repeat-containing protein [Strongylocentrotus purpuratus]